MIQPEEHPVLFPLSHFSPDYNIPLPHDIYSLIQDGSIQLQIFFVGLH
jgi:hypothetical protein